MAICDALDSAPDAPRPPMTLRRASMPPKTLNPPRSR